MKKYLFLLFTILLITGCTNKVDAVETSEPETSQITTEATTEEQVYLQLENLDLDDYNLNVHTTNMSTISMILTFKTKNIENNVDILKQYIDKYQSDEYKLYEKMDIIIGSNDDPVALLMFENVTGTWNNINSNWFDDVFHSTFNYKNVEKFDELIASTLTPHTEDVDDNGVKRVMYSFGSTESASVIMKYSLPSGEVNSNVELINGYLRDFEGVDSKNINTISLMFDVDGKYIAMIGLEKYSSKMIPRTYTICDVSYYEYFE